MGLQETIDKQMQGEGFSDLLMLLMDQVVNNNSATNTDMDLAEAISPDTFLSGITDDNQGSGQEATLQGEAGTLPFVAILPTMQEIIAPFQVEQDAKGAEGVSTLSVENQANQLGNCVGTLTEKLTQTSFKKPDEEPNKAGSPVQLMPDLENDSEGISFRAPMAISDHSSATSKSLPTNVAQQIKPAINDGLGEVPIVKLPDQQSANQQTVVNLPNVQKQALQQAILYQPNLKVVQGQEKMEKKSLEQPSDFSQAIQSDKLGLETVGLAVTNTQSNKDGSEVIGVAALQLVNRPEADAEQINGKSNQSLQTIKALDQQVEGKLTNTNVDRQPSVTKPGLELQSNKDGMQQDNAFQNRQDTLVQHSGKTIEQPIQTLPKELPLTQLPTKVAEIIRAMMVQQSSGQTSLKMKLQPEQLGEVTVKLTWSKGELSAHFITASGIARDALESSLPQLKELLAQQNIRLSEAAVFMGQQSGQWEQRSFNEGQQWQGTRPNKGKLQFTGITSVAEQVTTEQSNNTTNAGLNLVI